MAQHRDAVAAKDSGAPDRTKYSWSMLLGAALFLLTRGYIFFVLDPQVSDVKNTYFPYALQAYDYHSAPYGSQLSLEYPPVGWWMIYIPRWLVARQITDNSQIEQICNTYQQIFRGLMMLCDLGSAALLMLIVNMRRPSFLGWAALTYTVTMAILGHLLYDRLDVALLLLVLAWAYCWLRSLDNANGEIAWSMAAYAILGLRISFKLIPIICVPFLMLADWRSPQRLARCSIGLAALVATAGLPYLIQYTISGPGVFGLVKYRGERGIQLESLYSTFMMLGSLLGWPAYAIYSHNGFDVVGGLAKLMTALSNALLYGFLAGTWLWAFFRRAGFGRADGYQTACFVLVGAVIFSKVLSPQYFVWAFPMALLLAVEVLPPRAISLWGLAGLLVFVAAITTWIFPYHYFNSPDHVGLLPMGLREGEWEPVPCIVLGVRNMAYLVAVIWLGMKLTRRARYTGALGTVNFPSGLGGK